MRAGGLVLVLGLAAASLVSPAGAAADEGAPSHFFGVVGDAYEWGAEAVTRGTVGGDLVAFGAAAARVVHAVAGDVLAIASGGPVELFSPIGGDARAAGLRVVADSPVAQSAILLGAAVETGPDFSAEHLLVVAAQRANLDGAVRGNAEIYAPVVEAAPNFSAAGEVLVQAAQTAGLVPEMAGGGLVLSNWPAAPSKANRAWNALFWLVVFVGVAALMQRYCPQALRTRLVCRGGSWRLLAMRVAVGALIIVGGAALAVALCFVSWLLPLGLLLALVVLAATLVGFALLGLGLAQVFALLLPPLPNHQERLAPAALFVAGMFLGGSLLWQLPTFLALPIGLICLLATVGTLACCMLPADSGGGGRH